MSITPLLRAKSLNKARSVLWEQFMNERITKAKTRNLRIALINTISAGFGDIIFAQKIAGYLQDW